jgi:hypothetical protein
MRWRDSNVPEYDLDTDELAYRDATGNELKRKSFYEPEVASGDIIVISEAGGGNLRRT